MFLSVALAALLAQSGQPEPQPPAELSAQVAGIAGTLAPFCKTVIWPGRDSAALSCVEQHLASGEPLITYVRVAGIDSTLWQAALQLASGHLYLLEHDSFGSGTTSSAPCRRLVVHKSALIPIACER